MKKIILASLVCFSTQLLAQKSFFGFDAGMNVANQRLVISYFNNYDETTYVFENLVRPTFGGFFQYNFSPSIAVRINARYMGLGCTNTKSYNGFSSLNAHGDLKIDYLSVPITFRYNISDRFNLSAGHYLSFMTGGEPGGQNVSWLYQQYDSGLIFGLEHDVYKNFALGVNYVMGLRNIWLQRMTYNYNASYSHYSNRALQVVLVYKLKKTSQL